MSSQMRGIVDSQSDSVTHWRLKTGILDLTKGPIVMGIVNATPDSFSDGGNYLELERGVEHALKLVADGAGILDIGGESTRPYSTSVSESEELERVVPLIEKLAQLTPVPISIDTSKPAVARAALDAGAEIINDVTGFRNPEMVAVAVATGAGVCVMHMQGTPQTMQNNPDYDDVIAEIKYYLATQKSMLRNAGVEEDRICLDPGIGFGKTHEHNIELIRRCHEFHELKSPILVGHSRKGFIGKLLGDKDLNRDAGTMAISLALASQGVHVIRVHNVAMNVQGFKCRVG